MQMSISINKLIIIKTFTFDYLFQQLPVPKELTGQLDWFYEPNKQNTFTKKHGIIYTVNHRQNVSLRQLQKKLSFYQNQPQKVTHYMPIWYSYNV